MHPSPKLVPRGNPEAIQNTQQGITRMTRYDMGENSDVPIRPHQQGYYETDEPDIPAKCPQCGWRNCICTNAGDPVYWCPTCSHFVSKYHCVSSDEYTTHIIQQVPNSYFAPGRNLEEPMSANQQLAEKLSEFETLEESIREQERNLSTAKKALQLKSRQLEQLITSCGGKPVYYGPRKYHVNNGLCYETIDGLVITPPEKPRGQPVK